MAIPVHSQTIAKGNFNSTNIYTDALFEPIYDNGTLNASTETIPTTTYELSYNGGTDANDNLVEPKNESEALVNQIYGLYEESEFLTIKADKNK